MKIKMLEHMQLIQVLRGLEMGVIQVKKALSI